MDYTNFHPLFKLQNHSFSSVKELLVYAKKENTELFLFLQQWFDNKSFIQVQTSGSTGIPKSIKIEKQAMVHSAKATGLFFHLPKTTTALLCMSPHYIAGKMMVVRALTLGWWLDVVPPSSSPLQDVNTHYDFSAMVPLQAYHSLSKLSLIKTLLIGGGVISNQLFNELQHIPTQVYATYGMTETITHIAAKKINHTHLKECYLTLPNVSVCKDNRGCLQINAPYISKQPIITNDLVNLISNTSFEWLGRYDTIVNSGGIKLIPEQIEEKISKLISQRFFVIGIPDSLLGEKLILVIEGKNDASLLSKIKKSMCLEKYEVPKKIYFLPKFIETPTKKIQRQKTLNLI